MLRVFVYAPKEWRLAYGKENNMLQAKDEKGIKDEVEKTDRNRAAYYNYYTQNRLSLIHISKRSTIFSSSSLGVPFLVEMIIEFRSFHSFFSAHMTRWVCALPSRRSSWVR